MAAGTVGITARIPFHGLQGKTRVFCGQHHSTISGIPARDVLLVYSRERHLGRSMGPPAQKRTCAIGTRPWLVPASQGGWPEEGGN
jgi:hypothetical protein